jgi:hypothetical protein
MGGPDPRQHIVCVRVWMGGPDPRHHIVCVLGGDQTLDNTLCVCGAGAPHPRQHIVRVCGWGDQTLNNTSSQRT